MYIKEEEKNGARAYTNKLLTALEFGEIDAQQLAKDLLFWVSEDTARQFALYYEYITDENKDEDENENE